VLTQVGAATKALQALALGLLDEHLQHSVTDAVATGDGQEKVAEAMAAVGRLAEKIPCGPDPDRLAAAIRPYVDAGFDEIHIGQIGETRQEFFDFCAKDLVPRL
jgi:hypothetical protein